MLIGRRGAAAATVLLLCGMIVRPGLAHDFWLVPNMFVASARATVVVRGQTSSLFPSSLSAVTPDRIADARVLTADTAVRVSSLRADGPSLLLRFAPKQRGQHVVAVRIAPRNVRESPESFRHYLDIEGAPEARQRYEREGLLPPVGGDSITRRYAKYAKTFVEVGTGARAYGRAAGHPLEFIPLNDPARLRAGDTLRVRLELLGKPAASARFHAGSVANGPTALRDTAAARRSAARDRSIETDTAGIARVVVSRAGIWNLRTLQIVPAAKGSGADWDVHWATITFSVKAR